MGVTGISPLEHRAISATFLIFRYEMPRYMVGWFERIVAGLIAIPVGSMLGSTSCLIMGHFPIDYIFGVGWYIFCCKWPNDGIVKEASLKDELIWSPLPAFFAVLSSKLSLFSRLIRH